MPAQMSLITGQTAIIVRPPNIVRVNATGVGADAASPYNANPWDYVIVDTSLGSVVINLPNLSSRGLTVWIKHDDNTTLPPGTTVTINGPAAPAVNLAQPAPNNGTFSASYQYPPPNTPVQNLPLYRGTQLNWFNGGSAGGYLLTTN